MKKETYKIRGMHCASCVAVIEKALSKTDGVHSANANFATETASVEFDENIVSESGLATAVEGVGYRLGKAMGTNEMGMDPAGHIHMEMEREDQMKEMKLKLVIGGLLSVLVFLGSFPEWLPFMPSILNDNWVLLILTTPVQFWVGAQ